ncbi:MAG TPA: hypothetical protein VKE69_04215, partial [Planctomycetota bacterium]|nr:hypothetical protein [Planctomycetota bacterium]
NPAKTEWVQYDTITSDGQFARLAKARWDAARLAVSMTSPPGLPTGGGTMGPKGGKSPPPAFSLSAVDYWIGEPDEPKKEASLVNAIRLALSFRGTNGTWSQRHELPTQIIPAFLTFLRDPFAGRPGRLDRICFMSPKQGGPTLWRTVNWSDFKWWDANKHAGEGWVATLEIPPSLPIPPGQDGEDPTNPPPPSIDSRDYGRILKAPSHELPRNIGNLRAGATFDGSGQPFGGTVDEIEFTSDPQRALAQRYVLASPVGATDKTLPFEATFLAFPHGLLSPEKPALAPLPADAGFLLLGNEVVAYDGFDAGAGTVTVANNGRGALGTEATPHGTYETAVFLDNLVATKLSGGVSQAASRIAVDDAKDFPPQGTVLIGNELLHYTHKADTELRMPEREKDSIDRDPRAVLNATREGTGVFRGRYGTPSETHASGDIVLRFPYRYWDRWAVGTDVPELSYFQVDERSAEALFRRVAWTQEIPNPNVSLECVARVDARVPWASEPAREGEVDPAKLLLFTRPGLDTTPNYVMRMGERIEVRFGVRYGAGAFDPIAPTTNETKRSDAWKITPRLRSAAIEAIAATRVVRREERR